MYLEKIKLSGFKSFAETTELAFDKGITAIVGPNGSGKSNIADAIRWVLGEQSVKSLRGKKMEDVIFAGTETKKPKNYAEVSLFLNNEDQAIENQPVEIIITRQLFRNGDSEYKINHKTCRLKAIHEIFMDTGLGKNGYSLISQGGIENITNATPLELRRIVEEAVEIVNFKTKQYETNLKLQRTEENLNRVQDIFNELEKQLKPLEKQSKKAKEYLDLHEKIKKIELIQFYHYMMATQDKLGAFEKDLKDINFEILTEERTLDQIDKNYTLTRQKIETLSLEKSAIEADLTALKAKKETLERKTLICQNDIENAQNNQNKLTSEIAQEQVEQAEQARLLEKNKFLQEKNSAIIKDLKAKIAIDQAQMLSIQVEIQKSRNKTNDQNKQRAPLEKEHAVLQEKVLKLYRQSADAQAKIALEKELLVQNKHAFQKIEQNHLDCFEEIQKAKIEKELEKRRFEQAQQQENQAERLLRQFVEAQQSLKNELKIALSKQEYLKKNQENFSDYFPAIRTIMKAKAQDPDIKHAVYGPVGDLISVDAKYIKAIEIALSNKSQNIVVEDTQTAKNCIQLLKRQESGRATFLPLNSIQNTRIDAQTYANLQSANGYVGIAADLVKTDQKFQSILNNLLGRIIIADDFKNGRQLHAAIKRYTIVTLDGEVFYPSGAIVGGSSKNKKTVLSKKHDLSVLQAEIKEHTLKIKALETQINTQKKVVQQTQTETADLRTGLVKKDQHLYTLESERKHLLDKKETLLRNIKNNETVISKAANLTIDQEIEKAKDAIQVLTTKMRLLDEALDQKNNQQQDTLNALLKQNNTQKVDLSRVEEKNSSLFQQETILKQQKTKIEDRLANKEKRLADIKAMIMLALQAIETQNLEIKTIKEQLKALDLQYRQIAQQQQEANTLLVTLENKTKDLNHKILVLKEAANKIELANNSLSIKTENLEKTIFDHYDLNFIMVKDLIEELEKEKLDISDTHLQRLKSKMANLGHVNISAIEDYVKINERYQFLLTQSTDLMKAKEELNTTMVNLSRAMEQQFSEKFAILQEKFNVIFKKLFNGGEAHLTYENQEDILESGILLSAQPPGKNLKHLSLLSGGEKSMTAIALLFSFLEINASPFCVIDEIDAALDDPNIVRFIAYLKYVSKDNQFIIISHRKTTLEVCDALYGVSMAGGTSKLLSLRLSDYTK